MPNCTVISNPNNSKFLCKIASGISPETRDKCHEIKKGVLIQFNTSPVNYRISFDESLKNKDINTYINSDINKSDINNLDLDTGINADIENIENIDRKVYANKERQKLINQNKRVISTANYHISDNVWTNKNSLILESDCSKVIFKIPGINFFILNEEYLGSNQYLSFKIYNNNNRGFYTKPDNKIFNANSFVKIENIQDSTLETFNFYSGLNIYYKIVDIKDIKDIETENIYSALTPETSLEINTKAETNTTDNEVNISNDKVPPINSNLESKPNSKDLLFIKVMTKLEIFRENNIYSTMLIRVNKKDNSITFIK